MPEMTVTVAQMDGSSTSAAGARDHRMLIVERACIVHHTFAAGTRLIVRRA
jgi:hypothetical protein